MEILSIGQCVSVGLLLCFQCECKEHAIGEKNWVLSGTKTCCLVIRKRNKRHLNEVESPKKKNYSRGFVGHCHEGNWASKRLSKRQFCSTFFSVNYLGWNQEIEWLQGKSSGLYGQKSSFLAKPEKAFSQFNELLHVSVHSLKSVAGGSEGEVTCSRQWAEELDCSLFTACEAVYLTGAPRSSAAVPP